jgi:hypothetical protein
MSGIFIEGRLTNAFLPLFRSFVMDSAAIPPSVRASIEQAVLGSEWWLPVLPRIHAFFTRTPHCIYLFVL